MEFISEILSGQFSVDFVIVSLVIAGGYFQKLYLGSWKIDQAIKTLVVSTIFSLIYIFGSAYVEHEEPTRQMLLNGFVNYALATSFYELIAKHVVNAITNFFDRKSLNK